MARESTQHKLDRVRSPRVQITYDVEVGGAIELKELPFVVGVLGDFTGQPEQPLAKLKDLLDLRTRLSDLRGSLQGNDKLEELVLESAGNTEKLDKLKKEMGKGEG